MTDPDMVILFEDLGSPDEAVRKIAKKRLQSLSSELHSMSIRVNGSFPYDETTRDEARHRLQEIGRSIGDLNVIYQAIERPYPDDSDNYFSIKGYLLGLLWHLHDNQTVQFLSRVYPLLPHNDEVRFEALRALAEMNTKESLSTLVQLLIKYSADVERKSLTLLYIPLHDHTENIRFLFPGILEVLDNVKYRYPVYLLLTCARENGHITASDLSGVDLAAARKRLLTDVTAEKKKRGKLKQGSNKYEESSDLISTMLDFLGTYGDDEVVSLLGGFLGDPSTVVAMSALLSLLSLGQLVDSAVLHRVAADPITRIDLYRGLVRLNREYLFPREFRSQEFFAEATMVNWLRSGMEMGKPPDKIHLLASREIANGDEPQRIFIYKFWYKTNPRTWMVGQAGPQPIDRSSVSTESYLTFSEFKKLDEKTIDEHMDSILEYLESI